MVATQNIDSLGPIWTFSLRGVLTFVASGLDINGYVLSFFEGTANLPGLKKLRFLAPKNSGSIWKTPIYIYYIYYIYS